MDRNRFVSSRWWLLEPDQPYAVVQARQALGQHFGWSDDRWYDDPLKLDDLYTQLESRHPDMLAELDQDMSDDARTGWLTKVAGEPAGDGDASKLSDKQRLELEMGTASRLDKSYTTLSTACTFIQIEHLRASINKSPDVLATIFQVAIGLAFPPASRAIAELASQIPTEASTAVYRAALALMNEEKTTQALEKVYEFGKSAFESQQAAREITEARGEQAIITKLLDTYNAGTDKIRGQLASLSDEELGLVYIGLEPHKLNIDHYRESVERLLSEYKVEVEMQGTVVAEDVFSGIEQVRSLRYILVDEANGTRFLAAVDAGQGGLFFIEEVSPDVRDDAIARFRATEGREIPTVRPEVVQGIPADLLKSRATPPARPSIFAKKPR